MTKVITRFPPSPTGFFHIGSARTALFNYLFARKENGEFVLRFEDTDKERSKNEYEKDILEGLSWLGLSYDNTPVRQSERTALYTAAIGKLLASGNAYEAEEAKNGSGKVIRFKNPNTTISFEDIVRGAVSFDTTDLGDFVVAKNSMEPLYHLAVVVDDADMHITHVIRGEDHISNTPRQILLIEALGYARPIYAHIPLILATNKSKLSKRTGTVSINEYRNEGFLPDALINYIALLGWNPGNDQEIFPHDELIRAFSLGKIQKGGAVFDKEKLTWMNREYLKNLSDDDFLAYLAPSHKYPKETFARILPLVRERISTRREFEALIEEGEYEYFFTPPISISGGLLWKNASEEDTKARLNKVSSILRELAEEKFTAEHIKNTLWEFAESEGRGKVLWPFRVALSGKNKSADPFTIASVLGKRETLARITNACEVL